MPSVKKNTNYKKKHIVHSNRNNIKIKFNQLTKLFKFFITLSKHNIHFSASLTERKFELRRKCFHLIGLIFPIITILIEKRILLPLTTLLTLIFIIFDYKNWIFFVKKIPYGNILMQLFREHELVHGQLCGVSWLLLGYIIVLTTCEQYLVAMSMAVLIVSDAIAAIIGKNFGNKKICGSKTLEGSFGFFLSGLFVITFFLQYIIPPVNVFNVYFLIIALFCCTIVELVAKNIIIDDNFAIPVAFCLTYKILVNTIIA